jgi:hypothetical protein
MNDKQRAQAAARQRAMVAEMPHEDRPPAPPQPVERPFAELVEEARAALTGRGVRVVALVAAMRFTDRSFQTAGMNSGDSIRAQVHGNGREDHIELVELAGTTWFLVWYLNPARREVKHDFIHPAQVKTFQLA